MSKSKDRSRFKPSSRDDGFIQLDILSCFKNWKLRSEELKEKKLISNNRKPPMFITISSDEEDNIPARKPVHRKVHFSLSDDEDDRNIAVAEKSKEVLNPHPNGNHSSTSKTPDLCKSSSIKVLQNKVICSGNETKANSENTSSFSKVTQMNSKNEGNTTFESNTSSNKDPTSSGTSTSPKSPKIIAKPEKKQINTNFLKVMNKLISRITESLYLSSILNEEETNILKAVTTSRKEYQYVCFKLLMWLPNWYNLFNFCEKINCNLIDMEVIDLFKMMKQNNIIETDWKREELIVLLNILSHQQVQDICTNLRLPNKKPKKDMIVSIINYCNQQSTLTFCKSSKEIVLEKIMKKLGKYVVKIKDTYQSAFYHAYLLSTFTNSKLQDKTQYFRIMEDSDFPEYTVQDHVVFYTRKDFVDYANACRFQEDFEKFSSSKDHHRIFQMGNEIINILKRLQEDDRFQMAPHLKRYTALAVYTRLLTKISNTLKIKYSNDVENWLKYLINSFPKSHNLGDWFYDLSGLTLSQQKNPETATKFIIHALTEKKKCLTEVQIQNLSEKGKQLKNMIKNKNQHYHDSLVEILSDLVNLDDFPQTTVDAQTIRGNTSGKKRIYIVQDADGNKTYKQVEQIALDYYERCGYPEGEHCEGSLIMATFTLFFWDIIYNPSIVVPGTFLSTIQQYPLDMYTTYFYTNRKKLIDKRLSDLAENWSDDETINFVTTNWTNYSHIAGLCNVDSIIPDKKILKILVSCIGRKILSGIYGRLVKDLKQYRSGMPDLLVWNEQEKKAKFVEVKGENDKLSVKQKLWLNYLKSIDANIEVCHVHSIGSKKKLAPKLAQPKTTSTTSMAGTSKLHNANNGRDSDISSDFETPPTSPILKKASSNIKKGKSLISSTPVKKRSSRLSKSLTSSPNKRKLVTQKSVEDTYKKSKTAVRTEPDKEKGAVVEPQNANLSLTSTEKESVEKNKDRLNTTASKMTQTDKCRVAYKNKENFVLKVINQSL